MEYTIYDYLNVNDIEWAYIYVYILQCFVASFSNSLVYYFVEYSCMIWHDFGL